MNGELNTMREIYVSLLLVTMSIIIVLAKVVLEKLLLKPRRIRLVLQKQGITGPKPSFPFGNISEMQRIQTQSQSHSDQSPPSLSLSDQWLHSLFPYFNKWKQHYGPIYMYSTGITQHLYICKPELIKELKLIRSLDLGRPTHLAKTLKPLLGSGILRANGPQWSFQRNLIAPEFFLTKVKNMVGFMEESTMTMIRAWERRIIEFQSEGRKGIAELLIDEDLKSLTADVISKACFGSSYAKGNQIFAKLATIQAALAKPSMLFGFLSLRFLPTKANKEIWKLKEEVETLILKVINDRQAENQKSSGIYENHNQKDFLQVILENAATTFENKHEKMKQFIVDNCKTIYFAGAESVSLAASWTLMLLASHPQWQERVRYEIIDTYGNNMSTNCFHDMDKFRNLKTLTMVIQESLRLYSPALVAAREALGEMKLGKFVVPKGINIWLFIPALHRDPEIWGPDASEFKPERFANGVYEACKYPQVYIPFGLGSRICLGQNFALVQLKIIISLLLFNFSFSLSPNYRHSPFYNMLLVPKYGVRLLASKVQSAQA